MGEGLEHPSGDGPKAQFETDWRSGQRLARDLRLCRGHRGRAPGCEDQSYQVARQRPELGAERGEGRDQGRVHDAGGGVLRRGGEGPGGKEEFNPIQMRQTFSPVLFPAGWAEESRSRQLTYEGVLFRRVLWETPMHATSPSLGVSSDA